MMNNVKDFFSSTFDKHGELTYVQRFLRSSLAKGGGRLLDVGCGKGKYLRLARELGFNVVGVDANQQTVAENVKNGFSCYHSSEFSRQGTGDFDVVIISHVIEHISPESLLDFFNHYLSFLKKGGYLIICTPLLSSHFYNDFDHIKPYQPYGIITIFGDPNSQVQYHSKFQLKLIDLYYRVYPFRITHARGLYVNSWTTPFIRFFNNAMSLICIASRRKIAKKDGWIALLEKL